MAINIAPKGSIRLISADEGPQRPVKIVSFVGRADTGFIPADFIVGEPPVAIINVQTGALATGHFGGVVTGGISQTDTGDFSTQTHFAIVTDTGTAGL